MNMLNDLRQHLQQELRIPQVVAERCVHSWIEQASCRACVTHCPKQAWHIDDDCLGIDTEACDGCGLCAPVCPQGAILHAHQPLLRQFQQHLLALVACEYTEDLAATAGVIPCIHALSLHDVLKLYRQGVRALIITSGDCEHCSRKRQAATLTDTLTALNQALTQRQAPLIIVRQVSPKTWQQHYEQTQTPVATEHVSRRHFLRRGVQQVARESLRLQSLLAQDQEQFNPPGLLLPTSDNPSELPYVPTIDAQRCSGCDTCFKICPHQALQFDADNYQYLIQAEQCSGCGLCVDLCEFQAITLNYWQQPQISCIPLKQSRCHYCGVDFHRPLEQEHDLCHVCARVNHYRNLFQVLE